MGALFSKKSGAPIFLNKRWKHTNSGVFQCSWYFLKMRKQVCYVLLSRRLVSVNLGVAIWLHCKHVQGETWKYNFFRNCRYLAIRIVKWIQHSYSTLSIQICWSSTPLLKQILHSYHIIPLHFSWLFAVPILMYGRKYIVVLTFTIIFGDVNAKQLPLILLICALYVFLYSKYITYTDYNCLLIFNTLIMRQCS